MSVFAEIILPVFAVVALGYAATWTSVFDATMARGLSAFVFWFALPVFLFRSMAGAELPGLSALSLMAAYYGGTLLTMGLGIALTRSASLAERAILGFGGAYANTVMLGIPLAIESFGAQALVPVFLIIAFHGPIFFTLVTGLIEIGQGGGARARTLLARTVRGLATNSLLVAIVLGTGFNLSGLALPGVVDRFADFLGAAALPAALFSLGASLRGFKLAGTLGKTAAVVAVKLVIHPLLVAILVLFVFDVPDLWAKTAILLAALPTGVNVYLFATRYDVAQHESAAAILLSTICALPMIALLLHLMGVGG